MTEDAAEPTPEEAAAEKRSTNRWAIGIAVVALAVCGLCGWGMNAKDSPAQADPSGDAKRVCQEEFIPKRLKAPRTAEFADVSVTNDGDAYTVSGSVDAQNGFGALIRSSFTCVVRESGDNWVLQSATVS